MNWKEYHERFCNDLSCKLIHGRVFVDNQGIIRTGKGKKMTPAQAGRIINAEDSEMSILYNEI